MTKPTEEISAKVMPDELYIYETKTALGVTYWENHIAPTVKYIRADLATRTQSGSVAGLLNALDNVQDWLGDEMFDDDVRENRFFQSTQEERAENISDMIRTAIAAYRKENGNE